MNDLKYEMRANKTPSYKLQSAPALGTSEIPTGMLLLITTYVPRDVST